MFLTLFLIVDCNITDWWHRSWWHLFVFTRCLVRVLFLNNNDFDCLVWISLEGNAAIFASCLVSFELLCGLEDKNVLACLLFYNVRQSIHRTLNVEHQTPQTLLILPDTSPLRTRCVLNIRSLWRLLILFENRYCCSIDVAGDTWTCWSLTNTLRELVNAEQWSALLRLFYGATELYCNLGSDKWWRYQIDTPTFTRNVCYWLMQVSCCIWLVVGGWVLEQTALPVLCSLGQ